MPGTTTQSGADGGEDRGGTRAEGENPNGMNKRFLAYIFDMDGTLVDNCGYHVKAWRRFSKKYGNELTEKQILDWMGAQGSFYVEKIMGHPLPADELDRLCREKEAIYRRIYRPKMPDGLREWLDYAHARKIKLALATGGPKENVAFILDKLDLRKDFDVIVDATMYTKSKPDPECFLTAAKLLGVEPGDCRVYEDALNGIAAAKAAGMQCHAVTFTNPSDVLAAAGPDRIFDSYRDLAIFPVRPKRTAEDERNIAYLDRLRRCEDEPVPKVPLACVVGVIGIEEIPMAHDHYALMTVRGPNGMTWRMCVERGKFATGDLGLFVSSAAALPDDDRWRTHFRSKERVYRFGFGMKTRVRLPVVSRGIYRNNPGLIAPLAAFSDLKGAQVGDFVAERLHIQNVFELALLAANRSRTERSLALKKI